MVNTTSLNSNEEAQLQAIYELIANKHYNIALKLLDHHITQAQLSCLPSYYHYRALIYYLLKDSEAALADLGIVIKHYPNTFSRTYFLLGIIHCYLKHDFSTGIDYLKQAININDKDPDAYCRLASVYEELGRVDEALAIMETALKLVPNLSDVKEVYESILKTKATNVQGSDYQKIKQQLAKEIVSLAKPSDVNVTQATSVQEETDKKAKTIPSRQVYPFETGPINTYAKQCGIDVDDYKQFFDDEPSQAEESQLKKF